MENLHQSYVHHASNQPLLGDTIGGYFDRIVAAHGDRDALVVCHQNVRWSYRDLQQKAEAMAAGLLALGLQPGDRVGTWSPNNSEWILSQLATAKAGLIQVCINPAYRPAELEYALNKVGCRALILAPAFKSSDYLEMIQGLVPELAKAIPGKLRSATFPDLEMVIRLGDDQTPGMINFGDLPGLATAESKQRLQQVAGELQFDDPINIQFTSGTTGSPKGTTLSHHNILNNANLIGLSLGMGPEDKLCIPLPLYHCFALVAGALACVTQGATMVFPSEAFEPLAVLQAIHDERCTMLHGVPTMFIAEMEHPDRHKFDLSCLKTGFIGGSPVAEQVMREVVEALTVPGLICAYGMTETSPVSAFGSPSDPIGIRATTVGKTAAHSEIKIIDPQGRIVPTGQRGELCVRGYNVMLGYWGDPEKTAETIDAAGWLKTGDLATLSESGYLQIVGRSKDMIIRGGENVYPREIEDFLYTHPAIQEVQVFGVDDARMGEEVCAWIQLRDQTSLSEEEVKAFCQGNIAHFKIPRYVRFVEEYPMTVTGKIQKFAMREMMLKTL